jgi:beta-lactamase class A
MPPPPADRAVPDWGPLAARLGAIPDGMRVALAARHLESGSTLEQDAERVISAASTIKTLILVALARALDAGTVELDTEVAVQDGWRVGGSGVLNWLHGGVSLPLRDHAWLMIAISDNTASNAIIEALGIETIRQAAGDLGLPALHLGRRFYGYVPPGETSRNEVTARALTDLLAAIWNDTAASTERCAWMRQLHADQQHRARLARNLPEGITYAGKTGTLKGISHDCGVIAGPAGSVAVSVLVESTVSPYDDDAFIGTIGEAVATIVS